MNIRITQVDNDFASQFVEIRIGKKHIGYIGRGESLLIKEDTSPIEIYVKCGHYDTKTTVNCDSDLLINWRFTPPYLVISEQK